MIKALSAGRGVHEAPHSHYSGCNRMQVPSNRPTGGWDRDSGLSRKVVLVGNSGVGKTALVLRFVNDVWHEGDYASTIGGSYLAKKVVVDDTPFTFQIWDTAGQERFRSMVRIYYRGAAAAIMCCDLTDTASFDGLQTWGKELRGVLGDDVVVCIAVTKGDKEDRQVTLEQLESYASSIGASVTVTSAMTKDGVEELFHDLARRLIAAAPKVPDVQQFSLEGDFTQRPACGC